MLDRKINKLFLVVLWVGYTLCAQENVSFNSLDELLKVVKEKNIQFDNANYQQKLADLTYKTALGNVVNPRIPTTAQMIDNTRQQVSFFPGPIFGLPVGTLKEVTLGQQYISSIGFQPQFDILNLSSIALIKSAKINQELVNNQNHINELNTYHQINAIYFNILSYQAQKQILEDNLNIAKNILNTLENKVKEGISRKQELNEAQINVISIQDKIQQLDYNKKNQEYSLAIFFEGDILPSLSESVWVYENTESNIENPNNHLLSDNAIIKQKQILQDWRMAKYQNLPVLSFISSFNWQSSSNDFFFHSNSNVIGYNYVGLKLYWDLPTTVNKLASIETKKYQAKIEQNNVLHSQQQDKIYNQQMVLDYEKSVAQFKNMTAIVSLKVDTYIKSFIQFQEGIIALDKLLIAQNDMLVSKLNAISALANIGFYKNKIKISRNF